MIKKEHTPDITIVGGQPGKEKQKRQIEVPVGLEQLLFLAAQDETLKADLLADRNGTVERLGVQLRPTEATTLGSVSDAALQAMIERIRPDNPKQRRIMRLVAATVTSLAAGTAVIACDESDQPPTRGVDPGTEVDGPDADAGRESDDTDSSQQ